MSKLFQPSILLKNRHIQTVYASFFRNIPNHNFDIEKFELSDGDFIECYWYNKREEIHNKPIVLLFHGLMGSYKSPYILGTMHELEKNGFASVVVHYRSSSGVMNKKPNLYHCGQTHDAREYINNLKNVYKKNKIFAVGYSLGANMILKLLGEYADLSPIDAVISVSSPLDLNISTKKLNHGLSSIYQYMLLKELKELLEKKYETHDLKALINLNKKDIKNLSTFKKFDEAFTVPINGFSSVQDYYDKSSSKQYLKHIKTNTLLINSLDDPFMSPKALPKEDEMSSSVRLEVYPHGGHVGFIEGSLLKPKYWLEKRIVNYFNEFV